MMHVKDLTNMAPAGRSGNPVALGTGEINYGPIFAAAKGNGEVVPLRARPAVGRV